MKVAYLELSGFRGFRQRTRVDIPAGFLVISGRNGTGKSTLIDAVEFVFTGAIGKYPAESGGKETIRDYFWWRGPGTSESYSVRIGLQNEVGQTVELVRTRDGRLNVPDSRLAELLCEPSFMDSAANVCRTSIIRDELITALSWDQTDTARFEFVRAAAGARAPVELGTSLTEAVQNGQKLVADLERQGEIAGSRLRSALAERAEASATAQHVADLHEAIAALQEVVGRQVTEISQLLTAVRRYLAERRQGLEAAATLGADVRRLETMRTRLTGDEYGAELRRVSTTVDQHRREHSEAAGSLRVAESRLAAEEARSASDASLAVLLEHGERLGRHDERCPLCRAPRTAAEYEEALQDLRRRLSANAASLLTARKEVAEKRRQEEAARAALNSAQLEYQQLVEQQRIVDDATSQAMAVWTRVVGRDVALPNANEIDQRLAQERERIAALERQIFVLEASQAIDRIARLESAAVTARDEVDKINVQLGTMKSAVASLKEADRAIRRGNSEVVDERLASISPLLSELYYRLRPHRSWRTIDYAIRGDVRRFLSLRVGEGLNPQFIFSSGERRAAGLAFLLAVSLSRPWCRWETLVLDDPVQHIDDFRALHLAEVLSAVRRDGRQIICAVEDPELADLLCRRLRSSFESPGARLDLEYDGEAGNRVAKWTPITPLPEATLVSA